MTLDAQKKLSKHIFRLLKVNEIVYPIGRTPKGNLSVKFNESNDDFEIMLDSVPLSVKDILQDENNIELKRMLEKYWFEEARGFASLAVKTVLEHNPLPNGEIKAKKKGRPFGSRNRPKNGKANQTTA